MDPPVRRADQAQAAAARNAGFASPTPDYASINPKFNDDVQRMVFAVQQSIPEAVRRVIRDNWEKCLLGSEFHQAFILNASIHHALPSITRRAVRDFGHKMVGESKEELIDHFSTADLDSVADKIIAKASDSFLDKCLEKRLLTIEAKPLINALARAERLGYEPNDMIQEDHHERVIPQEAYPGAAHAAAPAYPQRPQSLSSTSVQALRCPNCYRGFQYKPAHDYHVIHNVCSVQPPTSEGFKHACQACGQGFTMPEELQAHIDNRVCGGYPSKSSSRGPGRPTRGPVPTPPSNPVNILPSVQTPAPNGYQMAQVQPQATPTPLNFAPRRAASAAVTPSGSPNPHDPYAHLTPEDLAKMNAELAEAEAKYAPRFKEAESIADDNGRRTRIEGLRNSFGTKQSMIRKKYGVRLRERRTKAEIQAEKERLGIKRLERAERERARAAIITSGGVIGSSPLVNMEPSVRPVGSSGWVAANTPRPSGVGVWEEHDAKRRRMDEAGGFHTPYKHGADETPTRKVLSVDQMGGGLSAATATAAVHDPTGPPPSQPPNVSGESGSGSRAQEPQAPIDLTSASPTSSGTPNGEVHQEIAVAQPSQPAATQPSVTQPIAADDSSDDDEDDEDIPSTRQPQIQRQSLTPHKGEATVMS